MPVDERDYSNDRYLEQEGIQPADPRPIVLKQSVSEREVFSLSEKEKERRLKALRKRFENADSKPSAATWIKRVVIGIWVVAALVWVAIAMRFFVT